jgi:hypothetical protein
MQLFDEIVHMARPVPRTALGCPYAISRRHAMYPVESLTYHLLSQHLPKYMVPPLSLGARDLGKYHKRKVVTVNPMIIK